MRRESMALGFFVWLAVVVALTISTQRPLSAATLRGLANAAWAGIGAAAILLVAWAGGDALASRWPWPAPGEVGALLRVALGWGLLGSAALGLEVLGWARVLPMRIMFALAVSAALVYGRRRLRGRRWQRPIWLTRGSAALLIAAGVPSVLLALAPAEGFDAHLYHFAQPAWVLRQGGLQPIALFSYWHPGLSEGVFTWALAVFGEASAQLLSLSAALGVVFLAAAWAQEVFGRRTAAWVAPWFLSMPSALLIAVGGYVGWVLAVYALAALYLAWQAGLRSGPMAARAWLWSGVFAGFGMGTKYTAVALPLALVTYAWLQAPTWRAAWRTVGRFSLMALLVAGPWYARNAYYMGNPFYPHVFGGYAWDAFRAHWLGRPGTGLGTDIGAWLTWPWVATMGHRDASYYHGRIGPLFWGIAPLVLAVLWRARRYGLRRRRAVLAWALLLAWSVGLWNLGVALSQPLWQTRLLMPYLAASLPLFAYAGRWTRAWAVPGRLRLHYVVGWVIGGLAVLSVLEWNVFVAGRHPLAYILGFETRTAYYRRVFPDHADLQTVLQAAPRDARVYFFFEPRSYDLPRPVLPDAFLDHWAWNWHRYGSVEAIQRALACQGWTHMLVYEWGWRFERDHDPWFTPQLNAAWQAFLSELEPVAQQGHYTLYRLPPVNSYNCPSPAGAGPK